MQSRVRNARPPVRPLLERPRWVGATAVSCGQEHEVEKISFVRTTFPEPFPVGREQAEWLEQALDAMLRRVLPLPSADPPCREYPEYLRTPYSTSSTERELGRSQHTSRARKPAVRPSLGQRCCSPSHVARPPRHAMHPRPPALRHHEHLCACSLAHARRALASLAHTCVRACAPAVAASTVVSGVPHGP